MRAPVLASGLCLLIHVGQGLVHGFSSLQTQRSRVSWLAGRQSRIVLTGLSGDEGTSGEDQGRPVEADAGTGPSLPQQPMASTGGNPLQSQPTSSRPPVPIVGEPQRKLDQSYSLEQILKELAAIQQTGPRKYCILGTRHCSFLHQQIIELLSYALVLTGNHIYTSGSQGTNAAAIRGALRGERPELLTVILPQSLTKQPLESQELLKQVKNVVENSKNDDLSLDVASRLCNSKLLVSADQLIAFAFHDSYTVIEASREAQDLDIVVTTLYLD